MNSKILHKLMVVVGLAIGAAVSILPLSSHAATSYTTAVTLTINPSISITVSDGDENGTNGVGSLQVTPGSVSSGYFKVAVVSNSGYRLQLSSNNYNNSPNLFNSAKTSSIAAGSSVTTGSTAWGYKLSTAATYVAASTSLSAANNANVTYSKASMPTNGTENVYYQVGVAAANNVLTDNYSGVITVTATAQ